MTNDWSRRDQHCMALALDAAREAAEKGEVPVGALLLSPEGETLSIVGNAPIKNHDPTAHAEILALREGGQKLGNYRLTGCSLFVTLEPCTMCAGAISFARIRRLVFGACDVKGGAILHGSRFFETSVCHWKPEVASGLMGEEASTLLREFFKEKR